MKKFIWVAIVLFLGFSSSFGQMLYFSTSVDFCWPISIENHSVRVDLKSGYADVEEELSLRTAGSVEFSGIWGAPQAGDIVEIHGDLRFPANASVVGLLLWNGSNTILKAKLKPVAQATGEYESVVDRDEAPPPSPLDPALLVRKYGDVYSLSVYPSTLGSFRKIRLRYLVPIPSSGEVSLIPVGWGNSDVQLEIKGKAYSKVIVHKGGQNTTLSVPFSWNAQSVDSLSVSVSSSAGLGSLRTSFSSGELKGYYLWYNAQVPQELLDRSGLKREVVLLWNWNQPEYFLTSDGVPSIYGEMAIAHAQGIQYTINEASAASNNLYFGLVHRQRAGKTVSFAMGNAQSKNLSQIQSYLGSITAETLPSLVPSRPIPQVATNIELEAIKKKSQVAFDSLIEKSLTLFSPEEGVIKHIVVVVSGPQMKFETPNLEDVESIDLPKGVTLSRAAGDYDAWLGVNLPKIESDNWYGGALEPRSVCQYKSEWSDDVGYYGGYVDRLVCQQASFPFPAERQMHFTVNVNVGGQTRYYSVENIQDHLQLAFHTLQQVDSSAQWTAYNSDGSELASYKQTISSVNTKQDSGIVKIVGAAPTLKSDVYSSEEIGAAFGVVRTDYALVALESDSVGSALNTSLKFKGLPYLAVSEIFKPSDILDHVDSQSKWLNQMRVQRVAHGKVRIELQGNLKSKVQRIEIIDLHGRVVAQLDCDKFRLSGQLEWDGLRHGMGIYILRIVANSQVMQKKFMLY